MTMTCYLLTGCGIPIWERSPQKYWLWPCADTVLHPGSCCFLPGESTRPLYALLIFVGKIIIPTMELL